jgi:hypothetical protein
VKPSLLAKIALAGVVVAVPLAYFAMRPHAARLTGYAPKQTTLEYRGEAAKLTLAPGWRWPSNPIASKAPDHRGMMYERGFGIQAADHYWYCSWASRAVDMRLAPSVRRRAVTVAVSLEDTYYFKRALAPDSRPFVSAFLARAKKGQLAGLKRDVVLNCPRTSGG